MFLTCCRRSPSYPSSSVYPHSSSNTAPFFPAGPPPLFRDLFFAPTTPTTPLPESLPSLFYFMW